MTTKDISKVVTPDWENFARAILEDWPTRDIDGSDLFDLALDYGMIKEIEGGYNPEIHDDYEGVCPEAGDPCYEWTFRGGAGVGLYSIRATQKENAALLACAEQAEARVAELEGVLRELIEELHNCEKELTEELHNADFCGESLLLTSARAALKTK